MNQNSLGVVLVCIPFRGVPFLGTPEVGAWEIMAAGEFPFGSIFVSWRENPLKESNKNNL